MPDFTGSLKPPRQSAPPASPVLGQMYADPDDNTLYWYDGTTWVSSRGGGGGSGGHTIQDEGAGLTARTNLNFVGNSVTVTDDSANGATKVTIDTVGPSECYIKGTRAADQSIPNATETTIIWTSSESAGSVSPSLNTGSGIFTIPSDGEYTLSLFGYLTDNATLSRRIFSFRSNVKGQIGRSLPAVQGNNNAGTTFSVTLRLLAGEQVYGTVYQDCGAALLLVGASNPFMTITRVGPGPQGPPGGNATATLDPWHVIGTVGEPAFQNGWVNLGVGYTSAAYRKDPFGRVHLRGVVKSGTGAAIFALPAGYRPGGITTGGQIVDATVSNNAFGDVRVDSAGVVLMNVGNNAYLSLDGISFDTDSVTSYMVGPQGPAGQNATSTAQEYCQSSGTNGATIATANGNWSAILPLPTDMLISQSIPGTPDFERMSDGSLRVTHDGFYQVAAGVGFPSGAPAGPAQYNIMLSAKLNATPTTGDQFMTESEFGQTSGYPTLTTARGIWLTANMRVGVFIYCGAATSNSVSFFSIARVGGPQGPAGGNATATLDTMHIVGGSGEPAFQNGWTHYDSTHQLRFRKDPFGRVMFTGAIKSGTAGQLVFTLPVGYRPPAGSADLAFPVHASGGVGACTVASNGSVVMGNGYGAASTSTWVYLDDVEFDTETVTSYMVGPQGPPGPAGGNATANLDIWHVVGSGGSEPAFQNSWTNLDAAGGTQRAVRFTKDPFGRVMLTGIASAGANNTVVFTLPAGYRPKRLNILTTGLAVNPAQVAIASSGDVTVSNLGSSNVNAWVSFDNLIFDTETVTTYMVGPQGPAGQPKNPVTRVFDYGTIRNPATSSLAELTTALRMAVNFTTGSFVRFLITGQWEHNGAPPQWVQFYIYDLTAPGIVANGGGMVVLRSTGANLNTSFTHEFVLPIATSGAAGWILPGPRTLTIYSQTGAATCSLRNDTVPFIFAAEELFQ